MKKVTLESIYSALTTYGYDNAEVLNEISAELSKGQARKDANVQAYEAIHDLVMDTLCDTPVTISELYEAIENQLPDGMTKSKVQYAVTRLWQDEIVKVEGKPNGYKRA